ncbi:alpha/beta hydrolase family protein [Nitrospirillum pindoramense]|nr:alpha/beta fold hydrolase [Nitrospirillum amazonense]
MALGFWGWALTASAQAAGVPVPGWPLLEHHVIDPLGRDITYYLSVPHGAPRPLAVIIQGSGCAALFHDREGAADGRKSTSFFALGAALKDGRFTVLAVEKPHAGLPPGAKTSGAEGCAAEFNRDFTAERWLVALQAALADARRQPGVDPARTLAFGHSEGAVMAALLAGHDATITDVAAFGAGGPTPLFDIVAFAYLGGGWAHIGRDGLDGLADQVRAINADPDNATAFVWGHPYRRWSSFLRVSATEELRHAKARVYLAGGTEDQATPLLSLELTAATLLADGRDVTLRRIAGADHSLAVTPGAASETGAEYARAFAWFWQKDGSTPPPGPAPLRPEGKGP